MPEDVALMRQLGLQVYRFSTSWARICPDGGAVPLLQDVPPDRPIASPCPAVGGMRARPRSVPATAMGWEVRPQRLTALLRQLHEETPSGAR